LRPADQVGDEAKSAASRINARDELKRHWPFAMRARCPGLAGERNKIPPWSIQWAKRHLNRQLNGDTTMAITRKFLLGAVICLGTAAQALAHSDRPNMVGGRLPSTVYGSYAHCTPSNRIDLSRLQPGELAIMIQDRGYRESNGSTFDSGECW
jgi:hypothetical protein